MKSSRGWDKRSREDNPLLSILVKVLIVTLLGLIILGALIGLRIITL